MRSAPTTLVTLLGGEPTTDQYGDQVESLAEQHVDIPCSLVEKNLPTVSTESDLAAVVVRYYVGRVPQGTPVDGLKRIKDQRTGDVYAVDSVTQPLHPRVAQDIRLDLRRVS